MPRPQHEIDIFRDRRSWWRLYRFLVYQRTGRAHFYLLFWRIFIVAIAFLDDREEFETECFWKKMLTPLPRGHARIIDVAQFHAWLSTFYSFLKPQPLSRILKLSICVHWLFFITNTCWTLSVNVSLAFRVSLLCRVPDITLTEKLQCKAIFLMRKA